MPFMQAQAIHCRMFHVEMILGGTHLVPVDVVEDDWEAEQLQMFVPNTIAIDDDGEPDVAWQAGWYSRFSAPGYLDCTGWDGPYDSENAALDALAEEHDVCRRCWEQCYLTDDGCPRSDSRCDGCKTIARATSLAPSGEMLCACCASLTDPPSICSLCEERHDGR